MDTGSLWGRFLGLAAALIAATWVAGSVGGALAAEEGGPGQRKGHRDGGVQDGGAGPRGERDTKTSISFAE